MFKKRHHMAQSSEEQIGMLLGDHPTASIPSENQISVTKENTGSDFPPGMSNPQQYF